MTGAVTGIPEVDNMTSSQAFHAGRKSAADEIKRLRSLLVRYQAANYIPEDCDLYAETRAVLEQSTEGATAKPYGFGFDEDR